MASIKDRNEGSLYTGKSADSIARRVWGRTAEVIPSADPNDRLGDGDAVMGMVVKRRKGQTHVLAHVVIRSA